MYPMVCVCAQHFAKGKGQQFMYPKLVPFLSLAPDFPGILKRTLCGETVGDDSLGGFLPFWFRKWKGYHLDQTVCK